MALICDDFLAFEETLRGLRKLDDNIVHALNTTIPTSSFEVKGTDPTAQCKDLYQQLINAHKNREESIKKCIVKVSDSVHGLHQKRDQDQDNIQVIKELRKEQNKLRMMQNELYVEEVVRDRSLKIFHERCRQYYREPNASS